MSFVKSEICEASVGQFTAVMRCVIFFLWEHHGAVQNLLCVFGKPQNWNISILCSRTDVSFYSAADEVAGDSGVQGK